MSIISFKTSMIMIAVDSPVPTYSSIVNPIMQSVINIKDTATQSFVAAKADVLKYKKAISGAAGSISQELQDARDKIDAALDELSEFSLDDILNFSLPDIPGLPLPIFPDYSSIVMEVSEIAQAVQQFQLMNTLVAMIKPMVSFIGISIDSILPKDPIFGLSPLDILQMSGSDLYNMVYSKFKDMQNLAIEVAQAVSDQARAIGEEAIALANAKVEQLQQAYETAKSIVEGFLSKVSALLPSPIFPGISALQMEAMEIVKAIKSYVLNAGLGIVLGLINSVLGILEWNGWSLFPIKIPTLAELKAMLIQTAMSLVPSDIPYADEIEALIALAKTGVTLDQLIAMVGFPGFPSITLPSPLLPSISCLAIEIQKACQIMFADFIASIMAKLVDFVKSTLSLLGVQFPVLQIPFPVVSVTITLPDLPELPDIPVVT